MKRYVARLSDGEEVSPLLLSLDKFGGSFWEEASCRNSGDADAWFVDYNTSDTTELYRLNVALNTCLKCPIQKKCLEVGLTDTEIKWGVWGGYLPGERMLMKAPMNRLGPSGRQAVTNAMNLRAKIENLKEEARKSRAKRKK